MDKTILYLSQDKDEQMLLVRLSQRLQNAMQRNVFCSTGFLSSREQMLLCRLFSKNSLALFGGYETAERKIAAFLPDYFDESQFSGEGSPIAAVRAEFFEKDLLTHRDFLGALMGVGIKRETVGDILVGRGCCDFFLMREMLPYVLENLTSAGRTALHLKEIPICAICVPEQNIKTVHDTVSSLRLDSVIGSGFSVSRAKACELIVSARAEINHTPCQKSDKPVAAGDVISVRGLGKIKLESVDGTTKKGRLGITVSRYL